MKKTITVTEENISEFYPYKGNGKVSPSIGEILFVHGDKLPKVRTEGDFVQVTNWKPSANSLEMIKRMHDPEAEKYGWKQGAEITFQTLMEKKEIASFERWSIDYKFVK